MEHHQYNFHANRGERLAYPDPDRPELERATHRRRAMLALMTALIIGIAVGRAWYAWQPSIDSQAETRSSAETVPAIVSRSAATLRSLPAPTTQARFDTPQLARSGTLHTEKKVATTVVPPGVVPLAPPAANPATPSAPSPTVIQQPQMVALPGGWFQMGSHEDRSEEPVHFVQVRPFWIGKYPVTVGEWDACVAAGGCKQIPNSTHEPDQPMSNVSWLDAMSYVHWLAHASGVPYRLPSEAEWEYAARAGSMTRYWWGNEVEMDHADCHGCGSFKEEAGPLKVGSFAPNRFGLFDMGGDVAEWVADCWHPNYAGAPTNGAAWECRNGGDHVLRGGSWMSTPNMVRASDREHYETSVRYPGNGFRIALSE